MLSFLKDFFTFSEIIKETFMKQTHNCCPIFLMSQDHCQDTCRVGQGNDNKGQICSSRQNGLNTDSYDHQKERNQK